THSVAVGASVGVAIYPTDGTTAAELLTNGALALDRAKRDGRGVWRYCQPGMDQQVRERQALAHDLGVALAEHQFSLAYQPFFDAQTLTVVGYEALLRWSHPVLGAIPPARFIPIAEECGLIVPISHWVLRTACAEAATWTNPLSISINLSPAQFLQEDVAERVKSVLEETGLAPGRLELEITEGVTMADTQRALEMLRALRRLGVKLSMDDFGTGYSSLSYLRRFPFDKLKIDRSFIRDLDENEDAQPIVQAIIALSRSLRLEVTAEGVETERQLAYLRDSGCCYVQGYLLGLPEPAAQIHGTTRSAGSAPDRLPVSRAPGPPATDSACAVA
ncbi:MAG: EAL domain-containing protein, partial [Proteobacteria bacterium]|nr:EAL domain-containing protein [Pseudomonadota bacterium]